MNRPGETFIDSADALTLSNGRLGANRPDDARQLHWQVALAAKAAAKHLPATGSTLVIRRRSSAYPLTVTVSPLNPRTVTPFANQRWGVAIFFTTAEPKPPLPIAELARLFGLTMAEARVAASIADGMPLGEVAARHGVTKNTVRGRRFCYPSTP